MKELNELECMISRRVLILGIPINTCGYKYICQATIMAMENWDVIYAITKEVYPQIAKLNGVSPESVEKAMRLAIHAACKKNSDSLRAVLMGHTIPKDDHRLTNSEFIGLLAWKIGIERSGKF